MLGYLGLMSSDVPVKKSSPALSAVPTQEPEISKFSPEAVESLLRSLGAKTATMDLTLEQILTEMSRQTVLMRGLKYDHEVTSATVENMSKEQGIIKSLLTEVLARLPEPGSR